MNSQELSIFYPRFIASKQRGIIPHIPLPRNYLELVPKFREQRRKEEIDRYQSEIEEILSQRNIVLPISLTWNEKHGLTNISVGSNGGLDLSESRTRPCFEEHNLGWTNGFIAASIATKYVSELLMSE